MAGSTVVRMLRRHAPGGACFTRDTTSLPRLLPSSLCLSQGTSQPKSLG